MTSTPSKIEASTLVEGETLATFTPGPWKFIDATKVAAMQYAPICVIRSEAVQVASFSWNDSSPYFPTKLESQANARLISAAPDLLAALQAVMGEWEDGYGLRCEDQCRAAIAKALNP